MYNRFQYEKEQDNRYKKHLKKLNQELKQKEDTKTKQQIESSKQERQKIKIKKKIVILDSENRDKLNNINDFNLKLIEEYKNVYAVRILKTEYTYSDSKFDILTINGETISLQGFKSINGYLYLNGYKNIDIASKSTTELFSQLSPGINDFPILNDNIKLDPYTYILNPIEKKLNRFDIKILNSNGDKINIENEAKLRLRLTLLIVCLEY